MNNTYTKYNVIIRNLLLGINFNWTEGFCYAIENYTRSIIVRFKGCFFENIQLLFLWYKMCHCLFLDYYILSLYQPFFLCCIYWYSDVKCTRSWHWSVWTWKEVCVLYERRGEMGFWRYGIYIYLSLWYQQESILVRRNM